MWFNFFNTSKELSFSVSPAKHIHTYLLKHWYRYLTAKTQDTWKDEIGKSLYFILGVPVSAGHLFLGARAVFSIASHFAIMQMNGFLCPSHQEVALAISPFAGIGKTWNCQFRGQVRTALPLSFMFSLKHWSQKFQVIIYFALNVWGVR